MAAAAAAQERLLELLAWRSRRAPNGGPAAPPAHSRGIETLASDSGRLRVVGGGQRAAVVSDVGLLTGFVCGACALSRVDLPVAGGEACHQVRLF